MLCYFKSLPWLAIDTHRSKLSNYRNIENVMCDTGFNVTFPTIFEKTSFALVVVVVVRALADDLFTQG
jgi:hypothetical protein